MMKKLNSYNLQTTQQKFYGNQIGLSAGENNLPRYNKSIVKKFSKYFGIKQNLITKSELILDFGAGIGSLCSIFQQTYSVTPICIEIDPYLRKILKANKFTVYENTFHLTEKFSFVYASNVLEHIENDNHALIELNKCLTQEGKLAIYVPAFSFLFSELDRNAGHFRRYARKELITKVESAGFRVEKCFYSDSIGVLASLALKIFGYRNEFGLGSERSLVIYDRAIFPISRTLDLIGFRFFLGKNLYLFAQKI
jgi:SAM-dependent methyltransferase